MADVFQRCPVKAIADAMRLQPPTVYKWSKPPDTDRNGAPNPLDRIHKLLECTSYDPSILQWLCAQGGGIFVLNSNKDAKPSETLLPKASRTMKNFSEVLITINEIIEDGKITEQEAVELRKEWDKLKTAMECFVTACEHGEYRQGLR